MSEEDAAAQAALAGAIEVKTDVGRMWLHAHDQVITPLIQAQGTWEPELRSAILSEVRPGMHTVDVGANVGYFVRALAQAAGPEGHVTAIEPDPANLALLRRNVRSLDGAPVTVVPAAAWHCSAPLELAISQDNTGDHRIAPGMPGRSTVSVEGVALDDLLPEGADVLLLDTQGVEHIVLRGAERLLHGPRRPVVFAEFWPAGLEEAGYDPLEVLNEYRDAGLEISVVEQTPVPLGRRPSTPSILAAILSIDPERFGTLRLQRPQRRSRWFARRPHADRVKPPGS